MRRLAALVLVLGLARADFITGDTTPPMPAEKSDIPGSTCGSDPNHLRCAWTWNQLRAVWLARKPYVVNWEARVAKLKDPGQPGAAPYSGPGWATGGITLPAPMGGRSCATPPTCLDAATYNGLLAEVTDLAPYGPDLETRIAALEAGSVAASSSPGYGTDFVRANTPGGALLVAAKTANVSACPGATETCMDKDAFNAARAAGIDVRAHLVTLRADVAALEAPAMPGLYVATTGNDTTGDGTPANPYATLGKAQTVVRGLIAAGMPANGVTILLRGGVYPITSTMAFTAADSGAAGQLVTWKAFPGEEVRISGGVAVGSWTQMSAASPNSPVTGAWNRTATATRTGGVGGGSKIWWASIPGAWSLGSMSDWDHAYGSAQARPTFATFAYNGVGQLIAQYPKRTTWDAKGAQWGSGSAGTSSIHYTGTTEPTDRSWSVAAALPAADKPWVTVLDDSSGYTTGIRSVSGVSAGVLTLASYSGGSVNVGTNARWQVSNLLEEVTTAGEYWIDRANRVVYFLSPEGGYASPGADARVSQLQTPLATFASAHHMMFDGIIWEDAQKDAIEFDPGVGSSKANASTASSHDITIKNGKVRNTGGDGVIVRGSNHLIDRMQFHALGASGVIFLAAANNSYFDPSNTSRDYLSRNCTVSNSEFFDTVWYTGPSDDGHAAVILGGSGNIVTHNYFHDNRGTAVFVVSRGEAVTYNRFLRNALERADGGVLYQCRFINASLEIGYNLWAFLPVSSVGSGGVYATYADDGTAGWNVHHNVYYAIGPATYGGGDGYSSSGSIGALVIKGASTFSYNVFSSVKYARFYGAPNGSGSTWSHNQGDTTSPATNLQNSGATDWANPPSQSGETWTGAGTNAQAAVGFLSVDPDDPAFLTNNADGTLHVASAAGSGNIPINQIGITAP